MHMTAMVVTGAGRFLISTDRAKLDVDTIHRFLTRSYWAEGIPRDTVVRSIENSLCFGVYSGSEQVGFARVISDYATFAYIADVFILEPYRERGLGKELIASVMAHPELQGLRRWSLGTRDAHGLYAQFGFTRVENPSRTMMEIANPDVYLRSATDKARKCG
jgi:N-acetylglutamate synthase-like GNAT family acetyltransferase